MFSESIALVPRALKSFLFFPTVPRALRLVTMGFNLSPLVPRAPEREIALHKLDEGERLIKAPGDQREPRGRSKKIIRARGTRATDLEKPLYCG